MTTRDDIVDLLGRYCEAVLRFDLEAFRACWADDGVWVMPGDRPDVVGPDACTELFGRLRAGFALCTQEILSSVVEPGPDAHTVSVRSVIREVQWLSSEPTRVVVGVYHDVVAAGPSGRWRFRSRRFELFFRGGADLSGRVYERST